MYISSNKTKQMKRNTTVSYKGLSDSIELSVDYYLEEGCKGDYFTPPTESRVTISAAYVGIKEKEDILDLIDQDIVEEWEEQILKEYE